MRWAIDSEELCGLRESPMSVRWVLASEPIGIPPGEESDSGRHVVGVRKLA